MVKSSADNPIFIAAEGSCGRSPQRPQAARSYGAHEERRGSAAGGHTRPRSAMPRSLYGINFFSLIVFGSRRQIIFIVACFDSRLNGFAASAAKQPTIWPEQHSFQQMTPLPGGSATTGQSPTTSTRQTRPFVALILSVASNSSWSALVVQMCCCS